MESELTKGSTLCFKIPIKVPVAVTLLTELSDGPIPLSVAEPSTVANDYVNAKYTKYSGSNILVVEDNDELREYYKIILADYKITTCEHGQQAIDFLKANNSLPQLIISDLMMPVMDGMEFLKRVKKNEVWRNIPMIMLTAKTNRLTKLKALRIGIDDYLTKPFDEEELQARIGNLMERYTNRSLIAKQEQPTNKLIISNEESHWLEALETFILDNISSDLLSVHFIASKFNMSESSLLRRLKRITGMTPAKYLQEHKLNYSRSLLEQQKYATVAEVAFHIGYKDAKAFTRSFKQRFGKTPSEMLQ